MKIRFVCFLKMILVGHILDHVLDHMIIGLVTMALYFHKSDQSLRQLILLINYMLRLLALLLKRAIVLIDLAFIGLISL